MKSAVRGHGIRAQHLNAGAMSDALTTSHPTRSSPDLAFVTGVLCSGEEANPAGHPLKVMPPPRLLTLQLRGLCCLTHLSF